MNEKQMPADGGGGLGQVATACEGGRYPNFGMIFTNPQGQVVGRLVSGWLVKRVRSGRHQLRQPPAWCVDLAHLDELEAAGAVGVLLIDEAGTEWRATLRAFRKFGLVINRGHGVQVALPLAHWRTIPAGQLCLFTEEVEYEPQPR